MANEVSKIYSDIAELLNIARAKAYHTVNSIMVETYWKIGQRIVEEEQKTFAEQEQYLADTRVDVKPSLWQRIKQSKVARALSVVFRLRLTVQDALPEGRGE